MHAELADGPIREVQVAYSGDILNLEVQPVPAPSWWAYCSQ